MGTTASPRPQIWWSNSIFFVSVHLAALYGVYYCPPTVVSKASLVLALVLWQLAEFGITIGYHRLYSHRAFRASAGVRIVLAVLGSAGFQGSIKVSPSQTSSYDPLHDPYAATKGLLYSHMGWIFFKPTYKKLELVDREDLDNDPVVRFQHKYYVPLALFLGFAVPPLIGSLWGDAMGSFVWGGLVSRLAVWHCTFFVNSLAHWDGLQPYSDEDTSRGSLLLAILTSGEGSHNFHTFPHDFRSGPSLLAWDPSKWVILFLHRLGLVTGLRRARDVDMKESIAYMKHKTLHGVPPPFDEPSWTGNVWTLSDAVEYLRQKPGRCVVLLNGWVVDATAYLAEHPGGASILRKYALQAPNDSSNSDNVEKTRWRDASWAFEGGLNNHSRAAVRRMNELRIARLQQ